MQLLGAKKNEQHKKKWWKNQVEMVFPLLREFIEKVRKRESRDGDKEEVCHITVYQVKTHGSPLIDLRTEYV